MTALVVIVAYLVIGCFSAIVVLVRQAPAPSGLGRGPTGLLAVLLWPFMLPLAFAPEAAVPVDAPTSRKTDRAARLDAVARRLEQGWAKAGGTAAAAAEGRERTVLEGFLARLRANDRRLAEMDEAIGQSPASVRERLQRLRDATLAEIDQGIALLEELAAQLTLLRFSDLGEPSTAKVERDHIEDLLARIEALAQPPQPQNPPAAACG
ncbi:MAG: hypothetical protein QM765_08430 [Myxococcales bacterium]